MTTAEPGRMRLKLLLPTEVLLDQPVAKLIAEGRNGFFCLLPRHRDFVAALAPGVLAYYEESGAEHFAAIDEGVLVKYERDVMVSAYDGVLGDDLEDLQALVDDTYLHLGEQERRARTALSRLEAGTLRKFKKLQDTIHG